MKVEFSGLILCCACLLCACGGSSQGPDAGADAGADADGGIVCLSYNDCQGVDAGCASPFCDLNLGRCRCNCGEGECGDDQCVAGYCVGCAWDEHCAGLDCSSEPDLSEARCNQAAGECQCAGSCGDGLCDELESAAHSCPADCSANCTEGQILSWSCMDMSTVPWCICRAGAWDCAEEPALLCPGETPCVQRGGQCVDDPESCYEGEVQTDSEGCAEPSPSCCKLQGCVGAGESYYPYLGMCCPGLRALPSRQPMGDGMGGVEGVVCFDSCWALICAPCGDGNCKLHFGENFCTCPEDCPHPPYEFSCGYLSDCGLSYCEQADTDCIQHSPSCEDEACVWSHESHSGQICNPVTRRCQ